MTKLASRGLATGIAAGLGLISATALTSGWLSAVAAEPKSGDIRELLDPTLVAASACGSARWARNELFKPGVQLAALTAGRAQAAEAAALPTLDGLGPRRLVVTTTSETAQTAVDQGYAWLMGFNHFLAPSISAKPRRQTLPAPCAGGARRWRSVPTSTTSCTMRRSSRPSAPSRRRWPCAMAQASASRR